MAELHQPHASHAGTESHHEESDVNIGPILGFGAGLIVVGAIVSMMMWLLLGYFEAREARQGPRMYPLAAGQESRLPPEPRLQTNPREDLGELRAREDERLQTYGWVDKNAGVVRIPIDAAMKLILERGLPSRPEPKP
jgi:hypothetical protein